jgi:head-tail adaptor
MSGGPMSRRLVLEAPERVPDGAGGYSESWVQLGHVWGTVAVRGSGREVDRVARLRLAITVRAVPEGAAARPTAEMRFRDGDRLYRIEAVHEGDRRGRTLTCYATEEVGR